MSDVDNPDANNNPDNADKGGSASQEVDIANLSGDHLNKVLESKALWDHPRIKELREQAAGYKKLKAQNEKDEQDYLKEQGEHQKLAEKLTLENETLKKQLVDRDINQALSAVLHKENVVDLDGALKLVDRAQLSVDDNGQVQGVGDAITSLKEGRAYLFNNSGGGTRNVGTPSNPAGGTQEQRGRYKFKESQLTPEFYQKNKAEIDEAGRLGLIEQDGPPAQ